VVLDNASLFRRILGDSIAVTVSTTDDPLVVDIDSGRVVQVIMNLLANARMADPVSAVTISTAVRVDHGTRFGVIAVEDDGCGMSQQVRERVFDRFFTTRPSGSGVGLATVKRIVHVSGGRIVLDSAVDQGTTVQVELPLSSRGAG
jgi:signal transduction histidine kinase